MKKCILLIALFLVISVINVNAVDYVGDVDGDGSVGTSDYILIRKHLLNISPLTGTKLAKADIDGDNKPTTSDYILLRKMILTGAELKPIAKPTYEVKYYGNSIIETGLDTVTLSGSVAVPVQASSTLKLSTNTSYIVSFDYKVSSGTNKFNIDLFPDTLPEIALTANTNKQHYDWEVSSNNSAMSSCQLRFFDNYQEANEGNMTISNIMMGTIKKETKEQDSTLGTLPSPTRVGYKFLGWYTSSTGGTQVSSSTKVSGNMNLYPHWEAEKPAYDITTDAKFNNYKTVASCSSTTFRYKIIEANGNDYVLIWVRNPNTQLNSALAGVNGDTKMSADSMMEREIRENGYSNKCMVATNASFFEMSTGNIRADVILSKGRVVRNTGGATGAIGVDKNGTLREYFANNSANDLVNWGVRSTFRISSQTQQDSSRDVANRTQICQVDKNNFAILSGSGTVYNSGETLKNMTGCTTAFNLDGGGSRKLYYKTKDNANLTRRFGGGREVPDMLYFVE